MNIKRLAGMTLSTYRFISGRAKKYNDAVESKRRLSMLSDHIRWICREGEFNDHYFSQGLNARGTDISEFMGRATLSRFRRKYSGIIMRQITDGSPGDEGLFIKDKFYCTAILREAGFPAPETLFLIVHGQLIPLGMAGTVEELPDGEYFLKNTLVERGYGVSGFTVSNAEVLLADGRPGALTMRHITAKGRWIIQKRLQSHNAISRVNSTALNTTRIYTLMTLGGIEYLGGYQAFATGTALTDSWQHGSVYVGIDPSSNKLRSYGITSQSDSRDGIMYKHPDSGIEFKGYEIPFLTESVEICRKAHAFFESVLIIGWDVAVTDKGPVIVEANGNPGINVLQCFEGGIRKRVIDACRQAEKQYHG